MSKSKKSAATVAAPAAPITAPAVDAPTVATAVATVIGREALPSAASTFAMLTEASITATNVALSHVMGWSDFGALWAERNMSHGAERAAILAFGKARGVDFANPEGAKAVPDEVRDAICNGIRDVLINRTEATRYRRDDAERLILMAADDPRPADVSLSPTAYMVPSASIKGLIKKDPSLYSEMRSAKKRLDSLVRVKYARLFTEAKTDAKVATVLALTSPDADVRKAAEAEAAAKSAARQGSRGPIARVIATLEAAMEILDAAVKRGDLVRADAMKIGEGIAEAMSIAHDCE